MVDPALTSVSNSFMSIIPMVQINRLGDLGFTSISTRPLQVRPHFPNKAFWPGSIPILTLLRALYLLFSKMAKGLFVQKMARSDDLNQRESVRTEIRSFSSLCRMSMSIDPLEHAACRSSCNNSGDRRRLSLADPSEINSVGANINLFV